MTILEHRKTLEGMKADAVESIEAVTPIWSKDACRGYAIAAMKEAGLDRDKIISILCNMNRAFEDLTIDRAEELYKQF